MLPIIALTLSLLAVAGQTAEADGASSPLKVTYVGNTGFLVACQGKKVAIDALFGGWKTDLYDIPSDSVVGLMKSAQPPFDNIDIIAVTHWHKDHFEAGIVAAYLTKNPHCVVVCPQQVADSLAAQPGYLEFRDRVQAIVAKLDSVTEFSHNGISARILTSKHGSYFDVDSAGKTIDLHANTQNLEYLFTLGGRTVFHNGDVIFKDKYRYRLIGLGKDSIDIAFVQSWGCHELPTFTEQLVCENILPRRIFFTHLAKGKGAQLIAEPCPRRVLVTIPTRQLESWEVE